VVASCATDIFTSLVTAFVLPAARWLPPSSATDCLPLALNICTRTAAAWRYALIVISMFVKGRQVCTTLITQPGENLYT